MFGSVHRWGERLAAVRTLKWLIGFVANSLSTCDFGIFMVLGCAIWEARNSIIWSNSRERVLMLLLKVHAKIINIYATFDAMPRRWELIGEAILKHTRFYEGAVGIVARDSSGNFIAGRAK